MNHKSKNMVPGDGAKHVPQLVLYIDMVIVFALSWPKLTIVHITTKDTKTLTHRD